MQRILKVLNSMEEWTLVLVLLGLAFLSFVQVFCRYVLHFSFTWMEELNRYLGVFIAFLGASLGVKYSSHFSMDLIYERTSSDRLRHGLKATINIVSGVMLLVIAWYGWEQAMKLRTFGVLTSALQLPKYWAYLPIPFFSTVMAIRFLRLGTRHAVRCFRGEAFGMDSEK